MTDASGYIALITPLKDEISNIDKFLKGIEDQTVVIKCLLIIENDSTDGSKEYLETIRPPKNVDIFNIIHLSFQDKTYRVGKKYATIINEGLQWLKRQEFYDSLEFIGILDCDVFPEREYYEKLSTFLAENPEIGITSGLTYTPEGTLHIADTNFVRGNSRIWKKQCLEEAGYLVANTADTVSVALAHLKGWKTRTLKSAHVISREVNVRIANSRNKGYHAYYRGHTLFYAGLKSLFLILAKRRVKMGYDYFVGYLDSMIRRKDRIENPEVRSYFRNYMINKLTHKFE